MHHAGNAATYNNLALSLEKMGDVEAAIRNYKVGYAITSQHLFCVHTHHPLAYDHRLRYNWMPTTPRQVSNRRGQLGALVLLPLPTLTGPHHPVMSGHPSH